MANQHWFIKHTDNTAWLACDRQDKSANSLSTASLKELEAHIDVLGKDNTCKGIIFFSKKGNGFIAGADVEEIANMPSTEAALAYVRYGQAVFDKIEALAIPTVAMIHGFCMGGGLELAMACDYRVALETPHTKLGLPEVLLGIHPAWGGTVRLSRLINPQQALSLMLTGRTVSSQRAKKIGLVDACVPERQLRRAAIYCIENKPPKRQLPHLGQWLNHALVRPWLARLAKRNVEKRVNPKHYPAPFALLALWASNASGRMEAEVESVKPLIEGETAKELIRVFFLRERLKSLSKATDFKAHHVHVVGAGVMGGDIAAWCALQGLTVTLQDRNIEAIAPAIARAQKLYKKNLKKPRLVSAALDKLIPDVDGRGVGQADVIIEAIFEDLTAKQDLFKMLEQHAKPDAILATNTSSIPLDDINTVLKAPERLIGIHFFNPVAKMQLVELVAGEQSTQAILDNGASFIGQINRLVVPVKSKPGFLVNRILMPYLLESLHMVESGIAPETIDKAALNFGMMMGPVELADVVGLDVCLAVAKNLGANIPKRLTDMVEAGKLGAKTGQGFYKFNGKKPKKNAVDSSHNLESLAERLIKSMTDEAKACLKENVVEDADLLDAAMIFGTGFAPFRGGPMHYLEG